jgi:hypothetical protein
MQLREFYQLAIVTALMSVVGTFETCPPVLRMFVHRGRPEVAAIRSNRREDPSVGHRLDVVESAIVEAMT